MGLDAEECLKYVVLTPTPPQPALPFGAAGGGVCGGAAVSGVNNWIKGLAEGAARVRSAHFAETASTGHAVWAGGKCVHHILSGSRQDSLGRSVLTGSVWSVLSVRAVMRAAVTDLTSPGNYSHRVNTLHRSPVLIPRYRPVARTLASSHLSLQYPFSR